VLLISVDGLHQQDSAWYVKTYPHSVLATTPMPAGVQHAQRSGQPTG
jgi:hypothetical protein